MLYGETKHLPEGQSMPEAAISTLDHASQPLSFLSLHPLLDAVLGDHICEFVLKTGMCKQTIHLSHLSPEFLLQRFSFTMIKQALD